LQYAKFLLAPFSRAMVSKSDIEVKEDRYWKTYSIIVWILCIRAGLLLCLVAVTLVFGLFASLAGIPVALVIAKSVGAYLDPVNETCVHHAAAGAGI